MTHLQAEFEKHLTRRQFFRRSTLGLGTAALASLLDPGRLLAAAAPAPTQGTHGTLTGLHFVPRAKRVIFLFMSGGPSHIDLYDHKPKLREHHGQELPGSIRMGQRITGMTSGQSSFPCVASMFDFKRHGQCGTWMSELIPNIGSVADDLCLIKSMHTEAINHDPAFTYIQTGAQQPGRPSLGAWLSYGIGSENQDLPAFVVMISQGSGNKTDQPLVSRMWGPGFLPSQHQGVRFRSGSGDPVLYLTDPNGIHRENRRLMLDGVRDLNQLAARDFGDPEIATRIAQYEMAYQMQMSVPELTDISTEPAHIREMYGIRDNPTDGGFARNCLLARRMIERGVRFVQLMHRGWDQHGDLPKQIRGQCRDVDQPSAALVKDLKQRGLLEDTLVIWSGEFGRTVYSQGQLTKDNHGRDHHGRCFSNWIAGGGIKPGTVYGETDDYCYNIVENPVHIHDFNATLLHCLGIEHTRLTYRFQGRDFRLTDVHGELVKGILAA
ncbi:MAG: DUF1501 domain-containing protein [Verrucomicrobiales bacterium]|nr:DUF1501 domain-containing protein [Verrucomicrobiales bacterium]